jgi:Fe-S cluster assembly protein SufD
MSVSVQPIAMTAPSAERFVEMYRGRRGDLPGAEDLRERAIRHFARTGFPTQRTEDWKYTDLRRLLRSEFADPDSAAAERVSLADIAPFLLKGDSHRAVFLEGRFAPELSALDGLPAGVTVETFAEAAAAGHPGFDDRLASFESPDGTGLVALNAALAADGAVIRIDKDVDAATPIHVLHVMPEGSTAAIFPRNVILTGENAAATVVESYVGLGKAEGWTSAVTQVALDPGARLRHLRLQNEDANAWHVGLTQLRLARDARFSGFLLVTGARLSRSEVQLQFAGEGAECDLAGACLLRGRQHGDVTTRFDHASPHCSSRQVFKGVLDGRARSVFQGRVHVAPDAQKTDAHQLNRNLLLSPGARADSKPELIIFADDVKCSHGATVGDLDRDALFYLRARGIDPATAKSMLVEAFVRELLDDLPDDALRSCVEAGIADWLDDDATGKEAGA